MSLDLAGITLDEIDVIVGWLCTVLLVDSALERLHESQPGPASRRSDCA